MGKRQEATAKACFVVPFFPPDVGGCASRFGDLTRSLNSTIRDINVVTTTVAQSQDRAALEGDGMRVFRGWLPSHVANRSFLSMLLYLALMPFAFAITVLSAARRVRGSDFSLLSIPPLPLVVLLPLLRLIGRCPVILDVRDIWPDALSPTYIDSRGLIFKLMHVVLRWAILSADHITAPTQTLVYRIAGIISNGANQNLPAITLVPNGVDTNEFTPGRVSPEILEQYNVPKDGRLLLYSGAVGRSQDLATITEALHSFLRNRPDVFFIIAGWGDSLEQLRQTISKLRLTNAIILPPVPRGRLLDLIRAASLCIVALHPSQTDALPNKFFEYVACGKPVIVMASEELRKLVEEWRCGIFVQSATEIQDAVATILSDEKAALEMGIRGRQMLQQSMFTRESAANVILQISRHFEQNEHRSAQDRR